MKPMSEVRGVPIDQLDESSECPECGEPIKIALTMGFEETFEGGLRVFDLGYVCPECKHAWHEDRGDSPNASKSGGPDE